MRACGLIALILAGCGGVDGPLDAGDDELDAGSRRDAGHDDPGRDAGGMDAATRDSGAPGDAGETDAGAPDSGWDAGPLIIGECSVVPQAGCGADEACRARLTSSGREGYCERAGGQAEGCTHLVDGGCLPCRTPDGSDRCQAGLFCGSSDRCVRYCRSDADCVPVEDRVFTCNYIETEDRLMLGWCTLP